LCFGYIELISLDIFKWADVIYGGIMINPQTFQKVKMIQRLMYTYAVILIVGLVWNAVDGEIENIRQFLRGAGRSIVVIIIAREIFSLKKWIWWMITVSTGGLTLFGIVAIVTFAFLGAFNSLEVVKLLLILIPSMTIIFRTFILIIKPDVRQVFSK
jgi:hypothetical protein